VFRRFLLAALFTDRAIYGKKGIDIKFRLGLYRALGQKGLSESELKDVMLQALPLKLGEPFSTVAAIITIIGSILFIALATEPVRDFVLQFHRFSGGVLDYVLLAVHWLAFYIGLSLVAFVLALAAAIVIYTSRTWRFF